MLPGKQYSCTPLDLAICMESDTTLTGNQCSHSKISGVSRLPIPFLFEAGQSSLRLGWRLQVDRIDNRSGSEQSDSDGSISASDEEADDTQGPARKRAASNKARAAALDILQGSTEEDQEGAQPKSGLFSLPFMTRAAERQRLNAQQEAAAVLAQLEAEDRQAAAGSDADVDVAEPHGGDSGSGNVGRMSFGTVPASEHQVCTGASQLAVMIKCGLWLQYYYQPCISCCVVCSLACTCYSNIVQPLRADLHLHHALIGDFMPSQHCSSSSLPALNAIMAHLQQRVHEDEAASSSGEEEDAEAKAARLGMRIADGGAAASRPSSWAQGVSATHSKKKRKRARDAGAAADEEDTRDNRMASSSGPVAVDQEDADAGRSVSTA